MAIVGGVHSILMEISKRSIAMKKKRVLFVGSFKEGSKDGSVGGQLFACSSLINSELSNFIDWELLDTTAESNLAISFSKRAKNAGRRILLLIKLLLTKKVDAVLIFTADGWSFVEKGLMVLLAKIMRKRVFLAPRSGIVPRDIETSGFMRAYIPFVIRRVDVLICQSKWWKDFYHGLINQEEEKFVEIQNWIDLSKYLDKREARKQDATEVKVLYLSWVDKSKGIFDLINAANLLKDKALPVKYLIGGQGEAFDEAVKMVNDLGLKASFNFLGWVKGEEKSRLLNSSDIYVLPSYFEGYPNSLVEAMVSGLPVITTTVGSIPDIINNTQNGLLHEPGDAEKLSAHLYTLITDQAYREEMALKGKNTVLKNNSVDTAIQKFKDLII